MNINLYTLSKRENSTLQPSGSGTQLACTLKNDTSVVSPAVLIDFADQANPQPHIFNYAYIPDFGRYYFISDVRAVRGHLWEYSLKCDVLATYKSQIGNWDMYILRSAAASNGNVIDDFYPLLTDFTLNEQTFETPWAHTPIDGAPAYYITLTKGCFVLGVTAKPLASGYGNFGSIKYIALKYSQMNALISALMDNSLLTANGFSAQDAELSLQKSLINPLSYIKSCYWLPFDYDDLIGSAETSVYIWDWNVSAACKILTGTPFKEISQTVTLPKHPSAASRGRYLNSDPYTKYTISYPPFGIIALNSLDLINTNKIRLVTTVDIITGVGRLEIFTESDAGVRGRLLQRVNAQVSVPIQLAQVGYDYTNLPATAVGIGAEFLGGFLSSFASATESGLTNTVSKIGNAANASRTRTSSTGSSGNFTDLNGYLIVTGQFYTIASEDLADVGRPLCAIRKPSAIPGYIVCRHGDVPLSGTAGEQAQVRTFLEGGFFYE